MSMRVRFSRKIVAGVLFAALVLAAGGCDLWGDPMYEEARFFYDPGAGEYWNDSGTFSYGYNDGNNSGYSNSLLDTSISTSGDSGYIWIDGDSVSW